MNALTLLINRLKKRYRLTILIKYCSLDLSYLGIPKQLITQQLIFVEIINMDVMPIVYRHVQ